jgi:hypothetical protein
MAIVKRSFVLAAAILGVGLPSYGSLLTNGSFESGTFVPDPLYPGDDTMNLTVGATDMTGWTTGIADLAWIGPSNPFGLSASDGGYFLDLSGFHDNAPYGGVQQTVSTTIGAQYRISFDIGTDQLYDSAAVSVMVTGGVGPTTFTSTPLTPNRWETFTFDFTATSLSTTIELDGQAPTNEKYIGLDNVGLQAIPEPGTLTLVAGPGLLVFAAWRRLRKA